MKFSAALLLATSALADQVLPRGYGYDEGDYGHGDKTKTLTTYTTVTTCPVTSTYTKEGSTYCVTELTTSTIVVTDCYGCGVTTVQGPNATKTGVQVEYTTRTTVCPVTKTKTVGGEEVTVVYTETSTIVEHVKSTAYEEVKQPDVTKTGLETEYTTRTTVCPVTETKTVAGKEVTVVYTTTSTIVEHVKSTAYEEVKQPDVTKTGQETQYTTRTTVCPVTKTKTVAGKEVTVVYTETSTIVEVAKSTAYEEVKQPDVTKTGVDTAYVTRTTVCPVTVTTVVKGETITKVYTTTSEIIEKGYKTLYDTVKQPDVTKTGVETQYITSTTLCPVTETKTVNGEVITKVYTSTQYLVSQVKTTIDQYKTIYETATNVKVQTQYSKVLITVGGGTVIETLVPETTVQIPQTEVVTKPVVTVTSQPPTTPTSAPAELPTGAAAANQPAFALMAGLVGALALL